jgi:peroxiredoxin
MQEDHGLKFKILHDPNLALADTIGIAHTLPEELQQLYSQFGINLPDAHGMDGWRLPMPARYIIDTTGIIRDRHVHADYTQRPEPDEILEILRTMDASAA